MTIHPTAVVSPRAELGSEVEIGPYCVIEDAAEIGSGCRLHSHVVIGRNTKVGTDNEFFPFAAIGLRSQDLKDKGGATTLHIGNGNTFRENVTVNRSSTEDTVTKLGHNNFMLAYSHVAHDCQVADNCIFSNNASLAGHCIVEDYVIVSGLVGIHQFCRLGAHSIIGGLARITKDVPPYMIAEGHPANIRGINKIGLERRGFSSDDVRAIKMAYRSLFFRKQGTFQQRVIALQDAPEASNPHVARLLEFISRSQRGVTL